MQAIAIDPGKMLLNGRDAARALSVSERHLWTISERGELPYVRVGQRRLYRVRDLENFIDANTHNRAAAAEAR